MIATKRALYGDTHPDLVTSITNLGWLLKARDDLDAAESLFREALAIRRTLYGEQHPFVARSLSALADLLLGRGRHEEAERYGAALCGMAQEAYYDALCAVADAA